MEVCSEVGKYIIHPLSGREERTKLVVKVAAKDETRKDMDGGMDVKREDTSLTRSWSIDGGNPRFCQIMIDLNKCLHRITFVTSYTFFTRTKLSKIDLLSLLR